MCTSTGSSRHYVRSLHCIVLAIMLLPDVTQVHGSPEGDAQVHHSPPIITSLPFSERSDNRGIWESDLFFLQKLSKFFGVGTTDDKKRNKNTSIRRIERLPAVRPEMIPPQLYYTDRADAPDANLAMIGHTVPPPQGNRRLNNKQLSIRTRQPYFFKQKTHSQRGYNVRKKGEKQPIRRRITNSRFQRPVRSDVNYKKKIRGPIKNQYNGFSDGYTTPINEYLISNSPYTIPPSNYIHVSMLPPFSRYSTTFPNQLSDDLTRTLISSLISDKIDDTTSNKIMSPKKDLNFAPPRQSSIMFPSEDKFISDNSLQVSASSEKHLALRNHVGIASDASFVNLLSRPGAEKIRRKVSTHPRPAPRPQRIPMDFSKESSFEYNGSEHFQASPKEGSIQANAFQPIFRASQSLDVDLPASFMKPIHVASARALPLAPPAPPPEVLNFFATNGGAKQF